MAESPSKRRSSWPAVASAFAIILISMTLVGLRTLSYTDRVGVQIDRIQRDQDESSRILNELRAETYTVAIELRDYLLASEAEAANARQRLLEIQRNMTAGTGLLERELAAHQASGAVQRLRQNLNRYWQSIGPILKWTGVQRQERGAAFLQNYVIPERAAVLETTREIESLRTSVLKREHEELARARARFRNSRMTSLIGLDLFVLVVAVITCTRLRTLEQRAHGLQLQTEEDRENLRELSHQLVKIQEEERRWISRELHDQIGQMLTGIQMQFTKIELSNGLPEASVHLTEGKTLVNRTVRAVRDMAMGLRPSILDDLGLIPALEWQTREFSRQSGIAVNLKLGGNLSELPDGYRTCLYRIVQEALTNCGRHAQAKQVNLTLHGGAESIFLTVRDDGKGFDPKQLAKRGLGLVGIEERVRELGGNANILSQPGKGTLLEVKIPFDSEVHA